MHTMTKSPDTMNSADQSEATTPAESAAVEATPKPKVAKTPKSTKRKGKGQARLLNSRNTMY